MKLKIKKKTVIICLAIVIVLSIYPSFILGYTLNKVMASKLEGGRNGPLDAYRHTLASALVSYTIGTKAVILVTNIMESKGSDSNLMDRHNNLIGAGIGQSAESFSKIEPTVMKTIEKGKINTKDQNVSTWMTNDKWESNRMW